MLIDHTIEPHPDTLEAWRAFKNITTGSRQAAEDAAIEAYISAHEAGMSKEECERINSETFIKFLYGK